MTAPGPAKRVPPPLPKPDRARLHEAALRHLARYAATEAGLIRVLDRRVLRWAKQGEDRTEEQRALSVAVREVARRLVAAGLVDDGAFAAARAASLSRAGRSRRAIAAHLATRGVDPALRDAALPGDDRRAAAILCRRRRIGPFGPPAVDQAAWRRQAGILARNGFAERLVREILGLTRQEAEALIASPPGDQEPRGPA